jgi:hypothetical protein
MTIHNFAEQLCVNDNESVISERGPIMKKSKSECSVFVWLKVFSSFFPERGPILHASLSEQ